MKLVRWLVLVVATAAVGAFVAELLRPRWRTPAHAAASGYVAPVAATDQYVVLPRDR